MPLPDGEKLLNHLDARSCPNQYVSTFDEVGAIPHAQRSARRAEDGTRWCLTCDITLRPDGAKVVCDECAPKVQRADGRRRQAESRLRVRQQVEEQTNGVTTTLDRAQVEQIRDKSDALFSALGKATTQFPVGNRAGDWVDDLMHAVKDLQRVLARTLPRRPVDHDEDAVARPR